MIANKVDVEMTDVMTSKSDDVVMAHSNTVLGLEGVYHPNTIACQVGTNKIPLHFTLTEN